MHGEFSSRHLQSFNDSLSEKPKSTKSRAMACHCTHLLKLNYIQSETIFRYYYGLRYNIAFIFSFLYARLKNYLLYNHCVLKLKHHHACSRSMAILCLFRNLWKMNLTGTGRYDNFSNQYHVRWMKLQKNCISFASNRRKQCFSFTVVFYEKGFHWLLLNCLRHTICESHFTPFTHTCTYIHIKNKT